MEWGLGCSEKPSSKSQATRAKACHKQPGVAPQDREGEVETTAEVAEGGVATQPLCRTLVLSRCPCTQSPEGRTALVAHIHVLPRNGEAVVTGWWDFRCLKRYRCLGPAQCFDSGHCFRKPVSSSLPACFPILFVQQRDRDGTTSAKPDGS